MKILTVVFSLGKGGTERAAVNFAVSYKRNGHDSRILFTSETGPREIECKTNLVPMYDFSIIRTFETIQGWAPDIIHIHSHGLKSFQVEFLHSICPSAKFIETNVFSIPSSWEYLLSKSYQLSYWCLWLYKQRGGNINKASVIPNPVNCDNFYAAPAIEIETFRCKHGIKLDSLLLGRIGQAHDTKWNPLIIKAFEKVLYYNPKAQLLLVNAPESIVNIAKVSPAENQIIIISQIIGDEELRQAYSSIDLFVHSASQGESFGMVLAESLLCETPVITLATPWCDNSQIEVVPNGTCGFCVDSQKYYHKVLRMMIEDESLRARLGEQGRSYIKSKFNSNEVARNAISFTTLNSTTSCILPSELYNLENHPNKLTKWMIDKFAYRHLLYYSCNISPSNVLRLLYYASILSIKKFTIGCLRGIKRIYKRTKLF